jgi:hypothetical protein
MTRTGEIKNAYTIVVFESYSETLISGTEKEIEG